MKLFDISIALENKEVLYIDTEGSILYLDLTKHYRSMLDKAQMNFFKTTKTGPFVSTQNRALI